MSNVWFTSDTHFFHEGILVHRPKFSSLEEMTEAIISNWNEVVGRGDIVYHLGDFALTWKKSVAPVNAILERLKGQVFLIIGNHDRKSVVRAKFCWVGESKWAKVGDHRIHLCHYPIESWRGKNNGSLHLHGHSHGNLERKIIRRMDVGVDVHDFFPISYEEVRETLTRR